MVGPNKRRCLGGEWDGSKPSCFGLNQENDYASTTHLCFIIIKLI